MRTRLALIGLLSLLAAGGGASAQSQTSQLHDALHLTPAQEDAWRAYQRTMAPSPDEEARERQASLLLPTLPTPRRLALVRSQMQADLADFDRRAAAVTAFYDALTPDQQRTFDRQTAGPAGPPDAPRDRGRPLPPG